jgi:hypothetical protein
VQNGKTTVNGALKMLWKDSTSFNVAEICALLGHYSASGGCFFK